MGSVFSRTITIRWLTLGNRIEKAYDSTESNSGKSVKELQVEAIELVRFVFKKPML